MAFLGHLVSGLVFGVWLKKAGGNLSDILISTAGSYIGYKLIKGVKEVVVKQVVAK
jgi:hypothetical protein